MLRKKKRIQSQKEEPNASPRISFYRLKLNYFLLLFVELNIAQNVFDPIHSSYRHCNENILFSQNHLQTRIKVNYEIHTN